MKTTFVIMHGHDLVAQEAVPAGSEAKAYERLLIKLQKALPEYVREAELNWCDKDIKRLIRKGYNKDKALELDLLDFSFVIHYTA